MQEFVSKTKFKVYKLEIVCTLNNNKRVTYSACTFRVNSNLLLTVACEFQFFTNHINYTRCQKFKHCLNVMSLVVRKPVFRVSDQVRHKPGCTAIEDG